METTRESHLRFDPDRSAQRPLADESRADSLMRLSAEEGTRLRAMAERVLGSSELAGDVVQEAIVALWRCPDAPPNPRGWLVRTVLHRSLHARRTALRRRKWERLAGEHWAETCPICNPEHSAASRELGKQIDALLEAVPTDQRRVFELREFDGLEYAEIADRLGVPIGTVRSRLNRARSALREGLESA